MSARRLLLASACVAALSAGQAEAAVNVGVAAAVNQAAEATPPGGGARAVTLGDNIIHNERITTSEIGLVQVLLVDGTTFTVGKNSDITIDRFVYDPNAGTAEVAATLTKGALRFIGGRSSKTGGATIETPVGTIGVRGGVMVVVLGQPDPNLPANMATCVYGTCSLGETVFQAGQTAYPNADGGITVVTTTEEMAAAGNAETAGDGTQNGGSPTQPTAGQADSNTESPGYSEPPGRVSDNNTSFGSPDTGNAGTPDEVVQDQGGDQAREDVEEQQNGGGSELPTITLRALTAGSSYVTSWGEEFTEPGSLGLVGGSPQHDQPLVLEYDATSNPQVFSGSGELQTSGDQVAMPVILATGPGTFNILGVTGPGGATYDGVAYANRGFAFYELAEQMEDVSECDEASDPVACQVESRQVEVPFYALWGELLNPAGTAPSTFETEFEGTGVRRYSFTGDPIQGVPVPFFRGGVLSSLDDTDAADVFANSDIYVLETPDFGARNVKLLQSWIVIDGNGVEQQSGIGVTTGEFNSVDGDIYGLRTGRRGGFRADASDPSSLAYGSLNTLAGPDGQEVFGPGGSNFVLSTDITNADAFGDGAADGFEHFNTVHVASLESAPFTPGSVTGRSLTGYAAALSETHSPQSSQYAVSPMFGANLGSVQIDFDATTRSIGGQLVVLDALQASALASTAVAFGDGPTGSTVAGPSVFIDDDLYAAHAAAGEGGVSPDTFTVLDTQQRLDYKVGEYPVTFVLSSDAVPLGPTPDFMNGALFCSCDFLEWGWWGTQTRLAESGAPLVEVLAQSFHLGTWVAGDVVEDYVVELLDGGITGTATYSGHAIGSVVRITPNDDDPTRPLQQQYVAGGSATLTWDFSARSGIVDIVFDNQSFGGTVASFGPPSSAEFGGQLNGAQVQGQIAGAFVRDGPLNPNAGIIANFGVHGMLYGETTDFNYYATGIIAGQLDASANPATLAHVSVTLRVLTSADSYTPYWPNASPIPNPGNVGLAGNGAGPGEGGNDDRFDAAVTGNMLMADLDGEQLILPFQFTSQSTSFGFTVTHDDDNGEDPYDDVYDGTAYFGPGQFAAYLMTTLNGDGDTELIYAITGIPTVITPNGHTGVFEGGGVRTYDFSEDPIQQIPVPFMRDIIVGEDSAFVFDSENTDWFSSPLYITNTPVAPPGEDASPFVPHVLQAWLAIQGEGPDQVSGVGVTVTSIYDVEGEDLGFAAGSGRRGSFRTDPELSALHMGGGISTLGGPNTGLSQFFGPNAENFVIGTGGFVNEDNIGQIADTFADGTVMDDQDWVPFGTVHVATLVQTPSPVGETRTSRTIEGFTAGLAENAEWSGESVSYTAAGGTGTIELSLDAQAGTIGGFLDLVSNPGPQTNTLNLTLGTIGDSGLGRSSFIDDDNFALREARQEEHPATATIAIDDGPVSQLTAPSDYGHAYVVSGRAVPIDGDYMGGATQCTCAFMDWGWWGQDQELVDDNDGDHVLRTQTHLGTWVAGDIVDAADLPTTGSATYDGHAIGTVVSNGATYIAGGSTHMDWDFGSRSGEWSVSNFDGRDFGAAVDDGTGGFGSADPFFSGAIAPGVGGTPATMSGGVSGAFASNGADAGQLPSGVMGSFNAADPNTDWAATGTFMGELAGGVGQ